MTLPTTVTPGVTSGHLDHHQQMAAAYNADGAGSLDATLAEGQLGHDVAHGALRTWYNAANPGSPLSALPGRSDPSYGAVHKAHHEALHAWVNAVPAGSFMTAPAGATLIADLSQVSAWNIDESPSTFTAPAVQSGTGPEGHPILRSTLVDGQRATWDPTSNERNDITMNNPDGRQDVPLGATRTMLWHERFVQMPTTSSTWQLIGPAEIHGSTLPQATVMFEVLPTSKNRGFIADGGSATYTRRDLGPVVLNRWYNMRLDVFYTNQNTGWVKVWRDGAVVYERTGFATTGEAGAGYWKWAHYRNASINGTSVFDLSGCRLYRVGAI